MAADRNISGSHCNYPQAASRSEVAARGFGPQHYVVYSGRRPRIRAFIPAEYSHRILLSTHNYYSFHLPRVRLFSHHPGSTSPRSNCLTCNRGPVLRLWTFDGGGKLQDKSAVQSCTS